MLTDFCTEGLFKYTGAFTHDRDGEDLYITDNLITDEVVAEKRAIAELIEGSYTTREVYLTTDYMPNLKQNDIIMFKNKKWIVKEIVINYKPPELTQSIKGVRYD